MDQVSQIELLVRIAEFGSLTRAAAELHLSTSAASRSLSALESRLGVRLVERTTRRLWLTEAGHTYLRNCKAVLADLREAEDSVRLMASEPVGVLTVTSSISFATAYIAPALPEFAQRYPKLRVRLLAANRYQDFIGEGIDVAVRTRDREPDSGISLRKIGETRRVVAASPDYLKQQGVPRVPADLARHRVMTYSFYKDAYDPVFVCGQDRVQVKLESMLDTNDGQVLRAAALAHHGILIQAAMTVRDDLMSGRLIEVLPDWKLSGMTVNLAFQSRRHMPAKVRAFVDFMVEVFQRLNLQAEATPGQKP